MNALEAAACKLAYAAHAGQRRKYIDSPYIVHPAAVVEIVRSVPHTEEMLAAAWCHDVVEDTDVSLDDIAMFCNPKVAELVGWLTDVSKLSDGNRKTRKALDRAHSAAAPPEAQTIKLADMIDNTYSIVKYDPSFAKVYLAEKRELLKVMNKGDPTLYAKALALCDEGALK